MSIQPPSSAVRARLRAAIVSATLPTLYLCAFLLLMTAWNVFSLPSPDATFDLISGWLARYGLPIVALAAFIEGIAVVTLYFPGSSVIVASVVATKAQSSNFVDFAAIVAVASLSFF